MLAELRIPEMITLKAELLELIEQGHAIKREFMNKIMTELEKDDHERLLHGEMDTYTDCFTVDKPKILTLFDDDIDKLNARLENAKKHHHELDKIQTFMKDYFDTEMKNQLKMMAGLEDDWPLELRKLQLTDKLDAPNFESVTLEQLKAQLADKLPKLQGFNCYNGNGMKKIELIFTNGF